MPKFVRFALSVRARHSCALAVVAALTCFGSLQAQDSIFARKRVPFEPGFRVYIIPDMEGMAGVVANRDIISGYEGERYKNSGSIEYPNYRMQLTKDMNAVIAGARLGGARSFVVNEGHGGNLFANVIPWELDTAAILIRGYPKPLVMITAIDSTFGTVMFTGAHANAGSPGVIAHNFAFDTFRINGKKLNEVGINALIAGEQGVSVSLVSGDDVLIEETKEILGNGFIGVITKIAVGRSAAIGYSPEHVRTALRAAAAEAVRRELKGDFKPFMMPKPYQVEFTIRSGFSEAMVSAVDALAGKFPLEKTGPRTYRMTTGSAKQIGYLLDAIELAALRS
jgi:D-amino peptidase